MTKSMTKSPTVEDVIEQDVVRRTTRGKFAQDIERAKLLYNPEAIATRTKTRIQQSVEDAEHAASEWADDHKWPLAGIGSAILLYMARGPIFDAVEKFRNKT